MYKFKLLTVGLLLCFLIIACGNSEQANDMENKEVSETPEETAQVQENAESETESTPEVNEEPGEIQNTPKNEIKLDAELVSAGEELYSAKGCVACHTIGKGKLVGPDLLGVTERREIDWLRKWMKNPEEMLKNDPIAMEMLKEHFVPMPNQGLSDQEVEALIAYMIHEDQKVN